MNTLAITATATLVLAASLAACNRGAGEVKTETHQVGAFTRIEVGGGIGLTVRIGSAQPVEVQAQENILPLIVAEVQDGTLRIRSTEAYTTSQPVHATVVTPSLAGVTLSGGSQGTIDGLTVDTFTADLSGGSAVTAAGSASTITLHLSGGSRANLKDLSAKIVAADMSGCSTATVSASSEVNGSASGGSHLTVVGSAKLNVQTSGGSAVTK